MGLSGPGGYLVLVGPPAGPVARAWRRSMPGVALVAVNPPPEVVDEAGISVLRGGRLPLKSRSMRGVVLGSPTAAIRLGAGGGARGAARAPRGGRGAGPDPADRST